MASVLSPMRDPGIIEQKPMKRLTMVEKARLESLAAFGNRKFDSLPVRKDDFLTKLQSSATITKSNTQPRALTRLERAKLEANSAFKNIKLGQKTTNSKKRKLQASDTENKNPKKPNLTRLQKAKQEVNKAFENVSFSAIPKKRSKLEQDQLLHKRNKQEVQNGNSPRQKHVGQPESCLNSTKRITRSQSSKLVAIKSSSVNVSSSKTTEKLLPLEAESDSNHVSKSDVPADENVSQETEENKEKMVDANVEEEPKRLTRIEKAQLEAIESFKGQQLDEICKESRKIVAKYLKPRKPKKQVQTASAIPVPSSHKKERNTKTNIDFYSCIYGDDNLNDHTVLLETSKRVVETAISLETPEGSPMVPTGKH